MKIDFNDLMLTIIRWINDSINKVEIDEFVEEQIVQLFEQLSTDNNFANVLRQISEDINVDYDKIVVVLLKYFLDTFEEVNNE